MASIYDKTTFIEKESDLNVGDCYIDCAYHPCIIVGWSWEDGYGPLEGISLIDGMVRGCSLSACAPRKISIEDAIEYRLNGPDDDDPIKAHGEHPEIVEMCGEPWWKRIKL